MNPKKFIENNGYGCVDTQFITLDEDGNPRTLTSFEVLELFELYKEHETKKLQAELFDLKYAIEQYYIGWDGTQEQAPEVLRYINLAINK